MKRPVTTFPELLKDYVSLALTMHWFCPGQHSFSGPKVLHLLHCWLSVSSALARFDSLLRSAVQGITIQTSQIYRPVCCQSGMEAFGWDVSSLALPAFLASAASTLSLQVDSLTGCTCSDNVSLQSYLSEISTGCAEMIAGYSCEI